MVYIFVYFINVILVLLLKIFVFITNGKFGGQGLLKYLIKGLFFNAILSMTMEAYLEFTIYGFLNLYTINTTTNVEILGLIISSFCIF